MKANDTLNVEDVRKICKRLVSTNGDVVTVSQETATPVGVIIRIKDKKIFKAISDSYFDETTFGNVPKGAREPERVSIIPENSEPEKKSESEKEAEVKKSNSYRRYSDDVIRKICEAISEGTPGNDIVKKFGISKSTLRVIINKERHVDISDQYFTRDGYTITSKQTGKKYNLIPSHGGRAKITSATTTTTTATKTSTTSTSNLVSEIRDLGLQILMNSKINDLPDDIKSQVKEIIENNIDSMSLRDISKLGG
jgi:hypothetical protein